MTSDFRSADPPGPRRGPRRPVGESMWVLSLKGRVYVTNPAVDVNFDRFNFNYEMRELRESA
jgi:hypothetical protein